jgi:hypothetical protein
MRRDQLEHAIRAACQILEKDEVIIIGSQAILGTFSEKQLPVEATMSLEIDVLPVSDDEQEIVGMADLLAAVAGRGYPSSKRATGSASMASTSTRQSCLRVGGAGCQGFRMFTLEPGFHR